MHNRRRSIDQSGEPDSSRPAMISAIRTKTGITRFCDVWAVKWHCSVSPGSVAVPGGFDSHYYIDWARLEWVFTLRDHFMSPGAAEPT